MFGTNMFQSLTCFQSNSDHSIGPSGVRELPLASGIDEGGHYFRYFCHGPTQPQLELELDLIMGRNPPTPPGTFKALPGNLGS